MILILPQDINDASLQYSSVQEVGIDLYNGGLTYTAGQKVQATAPNSVGPAAQICTPGAPAIWNFSAGHLANGVAVMLSSTGTLPPGFTSGVRYYICDHTATSCTLSLSKNGPRIDASSAGTGDHTVTSQVHRVYQALKAVPVYTYPTPDVANAGGFWADMGATNRWKMFDGSVSSQTSQADSIKILFKTTGYIDSVALLNIHADTARFVMLDVDTAKAATISIAAPAVLSCAAHGRANNDRIRLSTTGALPAGLALDATYYVVNATTDTFQLSATLSGAAINTSGTQSGTHTLIYVPYDQTYNLTYDSGLSNWYDYYPSQIIRRNDYVEIDMPAYNNTQIEVTLSAPGSVVRCGCCIIGKRRIIGSTNRGATVGITDYSVKSRNEFGDLSVIERSYSKSGDFQVLVDKSYTGEIQRLLAQYRATPVVYIGSQSLDATIMYGICKDFKIIYSYAVQALCNINIEALT